MSVAVLENIAPMEAAARAITTPVTEFVMIAGCDEYTHGKVENSNHDMGQQLIERTSNPIANTYPGPLHASSHDAHQFP